jgi:hypothetical protein
VKQHHCECGFTAEDQLEFVDHLLEISTPADGRDRSGQIHVQWEAALTCRCGFTGPQPADLDEHFLPCSGPQAKLDTMALGMRELKQRVSVDGRCLGRLCS